MKERSDNSPAITKHRCLKILNILYENVGILVSEELYNLFPEDPRYGSLILCVNLEQLSSVGLVEAEIQRSGDNIWGFGGAKITPLGISYLGKDGGLLEEVNTLSIKFSPETIRDTVKNIIIENQKMLVNNENYWNPSRTSPLQH